MARIVMKGGKPMKTVQKQKLVKGVGLDLSAADHERLARFARERGLTVASYARMAVLGRLKADEAKGS
jgi:hypothetical protein